MLDRKGSGKKSGVGQDGNETLQHLSPHDASTTDVHSFRNANHQDREGGQAEKNSVRRCEMRKKKEWPEGYHTLMWVCSEDGKMRGCGLHFTVGLKTEEWDEVKGPFCPRCGKSKAVISWSQWYRDRQEAKAKGSA